MSGTVQIATLTIRMATSTAISAGRLRSPRRHSTSAPAINAKTASIISESVAASIAGED